MWKSIIDNNDERKEWIIETTLIILYSNKNGIDNQNKKVGLILNIVIESWITIKNGIETDNRAINYYYHTTHPL